MRTVRTTASALIVRRLPGGDDTGARLVAGQTAASYGVSHDGGWQYIEAPAGSGWASSTFLESAPVKTPTPAWPAVPHGVDAIRRVYGDPRPHIRTDGTVAPAWEREVTAGRVDLPAPLPLSWDAKQRIAVVRCHPLIVSRLESVYTQIYRRGLWSELRNFGGCYNWRNARDLQKKSTHAWGIAVDHDTEHARNGLGVTPQINRTIVAIFKDHGFVWGGEWSRPDGMHFQLATGY